MSYRMNSSPGKLIGLGVSDRENGHPVRKEVNFSKLEKKSTGPEQCGSVGDEISKMDQKSYQEGL